MFFFPFGSLYLIYKKKKKKLQIVETFKELIFNSRNYRRIKNNISNQERKALKDVKIDTSKDVVNKIKNFVLLWFVLIIII